MSWSHRSNPIFKQQLCLGTGFERDMDIFSTVLLSECKGDEERVFDRFFEYLDEFLEEKL